MINAKLLIADPNYLVRQGLKMVFDAADGLEVCCETSDYDDLIALVKQHDPQIVVIGLNVHGASATDMVRMIMDLFPEKKILIIDTNEEKHEIIRMLQMGVQGYILKDCDKGEILMAIQNLLSNKTFFCSNVIKFNEDHEGGLRSKLTDREIEIIKLISEGLTNKEIADKIYLSVHTVATHRKNLMRKLKAKNNVDLVISAIKESVITP